MGQIRGFGTHCELKLQVSNRWIKRFMFMDSAEETQIFFCAWTHMAFASQTIGCSPAYQNTSMEPEKELHMTHMFYGITTWATTYLEIILCSLSHCYKVKCSKGGIYFQKPSNSFKTYTWYTYVCVHIPYIHQKEQNFVVKQDDLGIHLILNCLSPSSWFSKMDQRPVRYLLQVNTVSLFIGCRANIPVCLFSHSCTT